ncbi:unnamed protein product (macronuclear) [Paramecium tetraurelia]|uniref:Uncharacterized protein n=1 Tax=Paramecium tetraurelia TaxID=5888 RepID=A0CKE2_PARTE|nr:uncharacterized protein GSPATT00000972001 [Paramecium tetraurelia]CAK71259.1 unnamed protein product [Paramecium tetraurelia]|eukprot:XP_001438656.1 hypothetical protein (macronuclear) [Paramecium tetraurelia strain d4-2]
MQKVHIAAFTDDKVFINLLDKEIERHVKEYFEKDQPNNENKILTSNKKNKKQYHSFSILHKNNIVVKDHKKIILKTFSNNTKISDINYNQFNDIPLSERFNKRCNIAQRNCYLGLKSQTQQTQRSEFKSINEEIISSRLSKTQRNNRMDSIQERIEMYLYCNLQSCKEYLAKEQQRLKMVEEQIEKNQFLLEELAQELEIVNSNKAIFNSIKNLDQQVYKNELNCINYKKVTQELYEFIQQIQKKYFKKQQELIYPFIQNFKNELNLMLLEYEPQIQQNQVQ